MAYKPEYHRKNYDPKHHRMLQVRSKYGLEKNQMDHIIEVQGGLCPICAVRPATHIDHDHDTGAVRGLLCNYCNRGIGLLGDDPDALLRAVQYLGADPLVLPPPVRIERPPGARHICGETNRCPGEAELRRMYLTDWTRVGTIIAELEVSPTSFYGYLRAHSISQRGRSRTAPVTRRHKPMPKIADRNGIKNPKALQIGKRLVIPKV